MTASNVEVAELRLQASDWARQQQTDSWSECAMHEAAMAQAHAILAVAEAISELTGVIADRHSE